MVAFRVDENNLMRISGNLSADDEARFESTPSSMLLLLLEAEAPQVIRCLDDVGNGEQINLGVFFDVEKRNVSLLDRFNSYKH